MFGSIDSKGHTVIGNIHSQPSGRKTGINVLLAEDNPA